MTLSDQAESAPESHAFGNPLTGRPVIYSREPEQPAPMPVLPVKTSAQRTWLQFGIR